VAVSRVAQRAERGRQRGALRGAAAQQGSDVATRRHGRRARVAHARERRARQRRQQADAEPRGDQRVVQRGVVGAVRDPWREPRRAARELQRADELRVRQARDPRRVRELAQVDRLAE
jgi:hypothetical protein